MKKQWGRWTLDQELKTLEFTSPVANWDYQIDLEKPWPVSHWVKCFGAKRESLRGGPEHVFDLHAALSELGSNHHAI